MEVIFQNESEFSGPEEEEEEDGEVTPQQTSDDVPVEEEEGKDELDIFLPLPPVQKKTSSSKKTLPVTSIRKRKTGSPSKTTPAIVHTATKKPHRFRAGTVALREIRKLQRTTNLQIPKLRFSKLVREIASQMGAEAGSKRFTQSALDALQEATETYLVNCFATTNLAAIHRDRMTIFPKDMKIATKLVNEQC
jgi:histone H3/H4